MPITLQKWMNDIAKQEFINRRNGIPKKTIVPCAICKIDMEFFAGVEILRVCSHCRRDIRAFQQWEKIYGEFTGWKSVAAWEGRYDE